jgi:O-antigen ligase
MSRSWDAGDARGVPARGARVFVRKRTLSLDHFMQALAVLVLAGALLWIIFGGIGTDPADASQTAAINPYNSIAWLALFGASLPLMRYNWRATTALLRASWPLLLLYCYFALSVAWALDPPASQRRLFAALVQIAILATVVASIRRAPVLHVTIAAALIIAAAADVAAIPILGAATDSSEGFIGLQGQKNQTGLTMMYALFAAAPCLAYARQRVWKALLVVGMAVEAGVLVLTRSTTSQALTLAALFVMPLVLTISRRSRVVIAAVAATVVLIPVAVVFVYLLWCAATGADPMAPLAGVTFTNRLSIWQFMVGEIAKRPWFGAGYSSFWGIDPRIQPSLQTDEWFSLYEIITEGHQGYLDLWATAGIFGLLGGLALVFRSIVQASLALNRTAPPDLAWHNGTLGRPTVVFHLTFLLALLVHNLTESGLFGSGSLLTMALLVTMFDLQKWSSRRP